MKRVLSKSNWPIPNAALEAALGRFVIAWSLIEQQLDFAIQEMLYLDHDLSMCVTANLGTKAKLDIYQAAAHCMTGPIDKVLVAEINKLVCDTGNASGELRNFIIHGQPFHLNLPDGKKEIWAKFSARKGGVRGVMVLPSADYVDDQTAKVKALFDRWVSVRERTYKDVNLWWSMPEELRDDTADED